MRGIHRSSVNSPHKGQWRGALMFSLIGAWTGGWVNNRDAGDLRRYDTHYDATVLPHAVSVLHLNGNVCIMCTASSSNLQNILNRCNWKEGMVVVGINACTRSSREFEWFNFEIRHLDSSPNNDRQDDVYNWCENVSYMYGENFCLIGTGYLVFRYFRLDPSNTVQKQWSKIQI